MSDDDGSPRLFGDWQPSLAHVGPSTYEGPVGHELVDVALRHWLESALLPRGWQTERIDCVEKRLGWAGKDRPTLAELGDDLGVTRERIRQIESKAVKYLREAPATMPSLNEAARLLEAESPVPVSAVGALLVSADLASRPLSAKGLLGAFELAGIQTDLFISGDVLTRPGLPAVPAVSSLARRSARSHGVTNLEWVRQEIEQESGEHLEVDKLAALLRQEEWAAFLNGGWFWDQEIPAGRFRLVNMAERMISACGPLSAADLEGGFVRQHDLGRLASPPPADVLSAFFAAHPAFEVSEQGLVDMHARRDPKEVLGENEYVMYSVLREAPLGVLDRQAFRDACLARGMNVNTFTVFTTYSPILEHPALDRWALRGTKVSPIEIELVPKRKRQTRTSFSWDADGFLVVDTILNGPESVVVGIPAKVWPILAARSFVARDALGAEWGNVRVDDDSTASWGYGPFIQHHHASDGAVLRACFDVTEGSVTLELLADATGAQLDD